MRWAQWMLIGRLVLSITFLQYMGLHVLNWPFEFRWLKGYICNPLYYHHQIGSIHLSHCCHIVPWLCVWDSCATIFCHLLHISREHWDLVSIIDVQSIDVQSMVFAKDQIHYGLQVVLVCLQIAPSHYHQYVDLSKGNELIKCLSGICCRACV